MSTVVGGLGASAGLAAISELFGRRRRYLYLCAGIILWLGDAIALGFLFGDHSVVNSFALYDAVHVINLDSRSIEWAEGVLKPQAFAYAVIALAPFAILALYWKQLEAPFSPSRFAILLIAFILPVPLRWTKHFVQDDALTVRSAPLAGYPLKTFAPTQTFLAFIDLARLQYAVSHRMAENIDLHAHRRDNALPMTLIVIVGESANRNHMGIYGYCRNTTPQLASIGNGLNIFTDAISEIPLTIFGVTNALSVNGLNSMGNSGTHLISALNQAGFDTYWISNQPMFGGTANILTHMAMRAHHLQWLNRRIDRFDEVKPSLDGALIKPLHSALKTAAPNKAYFLHLLGEHMKYRTRFPENYFPQGFPTLSGKRDAYRTTIINDYDRAVRYNDEVVAGIIAEAEKAGGNTAVVYFSDHGEEVFDRSDWFGHTYPWATRNMVEIPLLVWLSPKLRERDPELARRVAQARNVPMDVSDISPLMLDLASVDVAGIDRSKSPLSPNFKPHRRIVSGHSYDSNRNLAQHALFQPLCPLAKPSLTKRESAN